MSWVDVVIAAIVVVATDRGLTVGILRQLGGLIGFATGFVAGTLAAPPLALRVPHNGGRPFVAIVVVVACCVVGAVIGRRLGAAANLSLRRLKLGGFDRTGGAAFAAVGSLLTCWLVAGMLVNVSFLSLSSAIDHSRILAVLDRVMPPVPSVEAKVQALFRGADFPSVFANVVAPTVPPATIPTSAIARRSADGAIASVFKVVALDACGVNREGSGFVVAPGLIVTAAHVVAGARHVIVDNLPATLVGIDVRNDVAVLAVHLSARAIVLWIHTPASNTPGAVVGYPLNGPLSVTPAAVAGQLSAQSHDIYNNVLFTRHLVVVDANVEFGNSGSPLLADGQVAGMIFSKSTAQANVSYAVPVATLRAAIAGARERVSVPSGACVAE